MASHSCFLVMKKVRGRARLLITRGQRSTVHARSKSWALQILHNQKEWQIGMFVVPNRRCQPDCLEPGWHCSHYLIAKDVDDDTPLGCIEPNSPEWNDRIALLKIGSSSEEIAGTDQITSRQDLCD